MLYLERRRTAADCHHLDGILSYYKKLLCLVEVDRKHLIVILEKYNTLACDLARRLVMLRRAH